MPVLRSASAVAGMLLALAFTAVAAPPLTTIDDVLYKADGTRFEGIAYIEWKQFTASDLSFIAPNVTSVQIRQGVLRLQLVPTATAPGGAYYLVRYYSNGQATFSESWAVPPSLTPLRVSDVRISSSGAPGGGSAGGVTGPVLITDVTGLSTELTARPTKGPAFLTSRVAFINPAGSIDSVTGNLADCVRVDGTTGPCGSSGPSGPGFVDSETPAGAVDGSNTVYSLANIPNPPESLLLYRNGLLMKSGLDYSASGITITFVAGATPQTGDVLLASYRLAGSSNPTGGSGTGMPAHTTPQVICSSTGTGTSGITMMRLGSCTIPAGYLASGDRLEIQADYSHQGSGTGFVAEIRWGSTTILSRPAAAGDTGMAVRATSGIDSTGAAWTTQSWGSNLPAAAAVGQASGSAGAGLVVDFLGRMAASSSETVTLQSFVVIRYPAQSNP